MLPDAGASSISVTVRVRPFTIREAAQITKCEDGVTFLGDASLAGAPTQKLGGKGIRQVIKVMDDKCLVFDPPEDNPVHKFSRSMVSNMGKRSKDQTFGFDRVFDENTTQGDVYESTTRGLLDSVLDGYNATVFAYGATGCGKTHTITGTAQQPGIIFLTMQELFEKIEERSDEKQTEISLSYLEIYNETIRDLLVPGGSKQGLMLREDANQSVSVAGLSSHHPKDVQEVMDIIVKGNEYRTISPTEANATSSRSHAVLQINVAQKDRNADVNEPHTMATLSIIDLAGSERASATKNRGERLTEGANINKSLLALGSCINALCDVRKKNHVPYRNSKLTRLLKFSLGGNCKTVMIVCVSPSSAHFDETQNTLRYANRAKNIQTKVTRNVYNVNRHVKDFLVKIDEQMALINELKAQQKDSEGAAFVKFKKQSEKRDVIVREGLSRIRAAFANSAPARQESVANMKKSHQIKRRIAVLSAWVAAFDTICELREAEEMPPSLAAMRKTAQGILLELENSRQHYHQRMEKGNWERAIDSALQNSVRQLKEVDGNEDGLDVASLTREAEILKANASRDALLEFVEQDRGGDADVMQVLLLAQFEIMSSLNDILGMTEQDAVQHAKVTLKNLLQTCSTAASQVIKPDGSLAVTEKYPPTKRGTPKRKKQTSFLDRQSRPAPPMAALVAAAPQVFASPMKASPRRKKAIMGKKGVSFTPKKKSPSKRAVRWKDDTDSGALAEFEKTPQKFAPSPEASEDSITLPNLPGLPPYLATSNVWNDSTDSSPVPSVPEPSVELKPKANRFQAGFLAKKTDGSPLPPTITKLSSDMETSPLRQIDAAQATNRSPKFLPKRPQHQENINMDSSNVSSDGENSFLGRSDSVKISQALRRAGSISRATHGHSMSESSARAQRRRSPTAATMAGSPPSENMFTASHARRMISSQKESGFSTSVLSPRTAPIMKNSTGRRTTIGEGRQVSGMSSGPIRISGTVGSAPRVRESVIGAIGKGGWR
ncbi:P-loop containing nucleoside triphosphate hydrolase protein [Calycina marina]|uniref:P-loop containing nucleoside triphosphate hydrolase protein n=1 Tax=Calycina marina TaxID=1763456 RepID=A0A9P8CJU3_9HELO|nr:P-loop containing nucleoside triphosphate hydrolase protein [Calycina marina]